MQIKTFCKTLTKSEILDFLATGFKNSIRYEVFLDLYKPFIIHEFNYNCRILGAPFISKTNILISRAHILGTYKKIDCGI